MPQWVEEHHSLPVAPLLTTQGLAHRGPHAEAPDPVGLNGPDAEAIYIACLNGDVEALRPLLAKFLPAESEEAAAEPAADAEAPAAGRRWQLVDRYGWEPPAIATAGGHLETLKLLLEAGCEADARNKYSGRSALHRLAEMSEPNVELLEPLLAKGAIAGAASKDGATPLQLAATHGHLALVTALLEAGAAVDPKDVCDQTPLLAAAEAGHRPVCEALLEAGAELEAADVNGWTPLVHACAAGHAELAELFVSRGADPERKTRGERSCRRLQPSFFEPGGVVVVALQKLADAKAAAEAEAAEGAEAE